MADIDKIELDGTTYNVSLSPDGKLDSSNSVPGKFNSQDKYVEENDSYDSQVSVITNNDNHSSIFSKITRMIYNIRWMYSKLGALNFSSEVGSTVTGAINYLNNNKADINHTHSVSELPVSNQHTNSTAYIPTSALVNTMNNAITTLNSNTTISGRSSLIYNYYPGGLHPYSYPSGTSIKTILNDILFGYQSASKNSPKAILDSAAAVTNFFNNFNPAEYKLGQYINIVYKVGSTTITAYCRIANIYGTGFKMICWDCSDSNYLTSKQWHNNEDIIGYKSSFMNTDILRTHSSTSKYTIADIIIRRLGESHMAINPEAGHVSTSIGNHPITGNKYVAACGNSESYLVLPSIRELLGEHGAGISDGDHHVQGDYQYPIFKFDSKVYTLTRTFAGIHYQTGRSLIWKTVSDTSARLSLAYQTTENTIRPIFEMYK